MELLIYDNETLLAKAAASYIAGILHEKPGALICLATGDTPILTYQALAELRSAGLDTSRCFIIGLDEWVGLGPQDAGSCRHFLGEHVVLPLGISAAQHHFFDGLAADLQQECSTMDNLIRERGGIDLMVAGVGMNGHIGFNEPGVADDNGSHVVALHATTVSVGQKYFKQPTHLQKGITLGLQHFFNARQVLMLATGSKKAPVIKAVVKGEVSTALPASTIRKHAGGRLLLDRSAAELLATPL